MDEWMDGIGQVVGAGALEVGYDPSEGEVMRISSGHAGAQGALAAQLATLQTTDLPSGAAHGLQRKCPVLSQLQRRVHRFSQTRSPTWGGRPDQHALPSPAQVDPNRAWWRPKAGLAADPEEQRLRGWLSMGWAGMPCPDSTAGGLTVMTGYCLTQRAANL